MQHEAHIQEPCRPFNGDEFRACMRDDRQVYHAGQRVEYVITHPAFNNACNRVARMYDALHAPDTKDKFFKLM